MSRKQIDPFFLIVVDRDQGIFSVEGPMTDDTEWVEAVVGAQKTGRDIHCSSGPGPRSRLESECFRDLGCRLVTPGSIVDVLLP
jgi:hypothetical protein